VYPLELEAKRGCAMREREKHLSRPCTLPDRYVGTEELEGLCGTIRGEMQRLVAEPAAQFARAEGLRDEIKANLEVFGYGF